MHRRLAFLLLVPMTACGGTDSGRGDADGSGVASLGGDGSGGAGDGTADDGGDASADGDGADGTAGDPSGPSGADGPLFDVGSPDGEATCGGGNADPGATLSYIWIANSSQGTVTKLATQTMVEEGRYIVRPDAAGSPSRTSVNLNGDVAIANRSGGVTKIFARPTDCAESNGMPGIQTSSGAADVLAWGTEECVAWHTPLTCSSNRPMAWTRGEWSDTTCRYEGAKLWTECWDPNIGAQVMLMDGETGAVEQTIVVPNVNAMVYGGAVDGDGNFWGVQSGQQLLRVDATDFTVQTWATPATGPSYGIAVDNDGRPWLCGGGGAARFDIATGTYQTLLGPGSPIGGCMVDADGILWHSRYPEGVLVGIDTATVSFVTELPIPAYVHGVSIDFQGNVWGVAFGGSEAYRVNPTTGQVDTYAGLIGAYTYSDMTGFALSSAGIPSG
jgi:hypothetical protein